MSCRRLLSVGPAKVTPGSTDQSDQSQSYLDDDQIAAGFACCVFRIPSVTAL